MKKSVLIILCLLSFSAAAFSELIESVDYYVDYKQNPPNTADALHVNFITLMPNPSAAAEIVKQELAAYGRRGGNKNIVGSAWHTVTGDEKDLRKINFSTNLGAYVWIASSKRIVPFNEYISILKQRRRSR
ncbi:MAG: hypothetical protein LBQ37_00795 [Elusimicrobiota bacterium]|jgi:hypothetical protein|nr:hypothetical protein [Elusimicrobiota bacterium]